MTRDQRGLADIRIADQADIGQKLQFQAEHALFAGPPGFMLARSLVSRGREACIAASTAPAAGNDNTIVGAGEVVYFLSGFVVVHDRAHRNFQQDVHALAAGAVRAFAVTSALRLVFRIEAEVHQRVVAFAGLHDDVAALAAIAARRSAARDKLLPAESHAAIAAVPGLDPNFCLVDEHSRQSSVVSRQPTTNHVGTDASSAQPSKARQRCCCSLKADS